MIPAAGFVYASCRFWRHRIESTSNPRIKKVLAFKMSSPIIVDVGNLALSDFNDQPYRTTTLTKLKLFRQYVEQWLPVFISDGHRSAEQVNIVDFFSGSGTDIDGNPGTPLLLLDLVSKHLLRNSHWRGTILIHLNDIKAKKIKHLQNTIEYGGYAPNSAKVKIIYHNDRFLDLFGQIVHRMNTPGCANLLFMDQSGNFQFTRTVFNQLMELKRTDALVFFASYFLHRFKHLPDFFQGFPGLRAHLLKVDRQHVHEAVKDYLCSLVPTDKEYYVGRYTLRNTDDASRVYGVIFCSPHVHGITKFVRCASKLDEDQDHGDHDESRQSDATLPLFPGQFEEPELGSRRMREIQDFKVSLQKKILSRKLKTDRDVAIDCITNGFVFKHGRSVVKVMMEDGLILNRLRISEEAILGKQAAREILLNHDKVKD